MEATTFVSEGSQLGYDNLANMCERVIDNIISSEDVGIMSGDILKAYTEAAIFKTAPIGEDFSIEPIYSEEVLSQITGCTLLGSTYTKEKLNISQDKQGHIFQGKFNSETNKVEFPEFLIGTVSAPVDTLEPNNYPEYDKAIVNLYKDVVTPDDTMVATRMTVTGQLDVIKPTASDPKFTINLTDLTYGSEIFHEMRIHYFIKDGTVEAETFTSFSIYNSFSYIQLQAVSYLLKFE